MLMDTKKLWENALAEIELTVSKANFNMWFKDTFINKQEEDMFFNIVKSGFAHKRKVLRKNLETITSQEKIDTVFNELKINSKARAEDIKLDLWLSLTKKLIK